MGETAPADTSVYLSDARIAQMTKKTLQDTKYATSFTGKPGSNHNVIFVFIAILCIVVGGILQLWSVSIPAEIITEQYTEAGSIKELMLIQHPFGKHLADFLRSAFFAAGVGILITIFITNNIAKRENQTDMERMQEIQKQIRIDVFEGVLQRFIPTEIFESLRTSVIETNIVRRDARWDFEFSENSSGIFCKQIMKYTLENTGAKDETENYTVAVQSTKPGVQNLTKVEYKPNDQSTYIAPEIKSEKTVEQGIKQKVYEVPIPKDSSVNVIVIFESQYPAQTLTDAYFTRYPLVNAEIQVSFPEGYDFSIFPAASVSFDIVADEPGKQIYQAQGGLLPYQGLVYTLAKLPHEDS
jgi:hypothetical protein